MIASWMLYSLLVGAALSLGAAALAKGAAARQRPTRGVWLVAVLLSALWPAGMAAWRAMPQAAQPVTMLPFTITVPTIAASTTDAPAWPALLDRALAAAWIVVSLLLIIRIVRASVALRHTRRNWRTSQVDGCAVQLTSNVGPAVVGLRSMDVVIPEWILSLDEPLRALVLRHENEHRRAHDPMLLFLAAVAASLMPWNLALWWQSRRLRLAIEMDCDARVLRAHPSAERYGLLMLTIAQRRSVGPALYAPTLSEPASQLERRILAMRARPTKFAKLTMLTATLAGAGAIAVACSLRSESPTAPVPSPATVASVQRTSGSSTSATGAAIVADAQVQPLPGNTPPRYPDMLRSAHVEGDVLAQFVVGPDGRPIISTFKVLKSTHDLFTNAVREALASWRFVPPTANGAPVKHLVQMPFTFTLGNHSTTDTAVVRPDLMGAARPSHVVTRAMPPSASQGLSQTDTMLTSTALRRAYPNAYMANEVTKQVQPLSDNTPPRYPDMLRSANVEGGVLAQFIVDSTGKAVMSTFYVVKSTHDLFTKAVVAALPTMRFSPAEVNGKKVSQLIRMPFQFSLGK